LLATLSPLGFAATIAVMRAGRLTALGFAVGVVFGQLLACTILVTVGAVVSPDRTVAHPTLNGLLELALAVFLVLYAWAIHRRPLGPPRVEHARSGAVLARLHRVHVVTASGVGLLLGIGGPKRLVLTALAAASITTAGPTTSEAAALIVWYGLLATVLVWVPVLALLLLGERAVGIMDAAARWISRHRRPATLVVVLLLALVLFVNAATLL
jgi:Sap, sulfolipid-1-addressing protein